MKLPFFAVSIVFAATASHAQPAAAPTAAPVAASAPVVVRPNTIISTADGHVIGRIDRVRSVGGVPTSASVIYSGSMIEIPISTIRSNGRALVTSLTTAQLRR